METVCLDASDCSNLERLPDNLKVLRLVLNGCTALKDLPSGISCGELSFHNSRLKTLPVDLKAEYRIDLQDSMELKELPPNLKTGVLVLRGCVNLRSLPEGLAVEFLDLVGCTAIEGWPQRGSVGPGRLNVRGCTQLSTLPPWLRELAQLDVSGCGLITELPEGLRIHHWVDIAGTQINRLPDSLRGVRLRWRGVFIDERIAFRPESITVHEILAEQNAELRRVLLERFGFSRFMHEAHTELLDRDRDVGGERRLLRVPLQGDEDLVCVSFFCPSTGRQYLTRVPPTMQSCHQAVAWIAGFDNPDDYRPLAET